MTKKQTIIYPAPQPELAAAITQLQAAVDTVAHVRQTVREWPAKVTQAETELAAAERELDRTETDLALARGDKSGIEAKVTALTVEAAEKRETLNRLRSRLPHLNGRGEEANQALESAKHEVRGQRSIYVDALREAIAGPYAQSAAVLAQHVAQHEALIQAADLGLSMGLYERPRVQDIRHHSRDLVSEGASRAPAASVVAEMEQALEPLHTARPLLSAARFEPRRTVAGEI